MSGPERGDLKAELSWDHLLGMSVQLVLLSHSLVFWDRDCSKRELLEGNTLRNRQPLCSLSTQDTPPHSTGYRVSHPANQIEEEKIRPPFWLGEQSYIAKELGWMRDVSVAVFGKMQFSTDIVWSFWKCAIYFIIFVKVYQAHCRTNTRRITWMCSVSEMLPFF